MGVRIRFHHGQHYVFINHRHKRKAIRCGTAREANAMATKMRRALAAGEWSLPADDDAPLTLRAFVATWKTTHGLTALKSSTLRGYNANLDQHILPVLGDRDLASITRTDCRSLLAACRTKGKKGKTLSNIARTLSSILTDAVEQGRLPGNPAFRMGRYCRVEGEIPHAIQPLSREEAAALLNAARDHAPRYAALVLTALRTGMRLGELLALEWGDIDFHGGFIWVRRNRVHGVTTTPKNGKARRVDMSVQLKRELEHLLVRRKADALREGCTLPRTLFLSPEGNPIDADNLRTRVWEPLLAKAGLRAIRFHDLRHTYASLLIAGGESLAYVRDQLGHSSIRITVDIYSHLIPGANRAAVDVLDEGAVPPECDQAQPDTEKGLQPAAATPSYS